MTSQSPKEYYYTYYSYEEYGRGYIGSRKCYCLPEEDIKYFGSFKDKTFKPTQKIILKSDYVNREDAYSDEIILQRYYKVVENPHFVNRSYQSSNKFYVPREQAKEVGSGWFSLNEKQRSDFGKIGGTKTYELGVGIHGLTPEQMTKNTKKGGKKGGKKTYELGVGIHAQTKEQRMKNGKEGGSIGGKIVGKRAKELGLGIFSLTKEEKVKIGKKSAQIINSQRWECCVTGYVSTSSGIVSYQKARGIDTSKTNRRRIS